MYCPFLYKKYHDFFLHKLQFLTITKTCNYNINVDLKQHFAPVKFGKINLEILPFSRVYNII